MSKEKKKSMAKYIIGNIVLTGILMRVIPRIIEAVSSNVYSKMTRTKTISDDDWGPKIVKRTVKGNNK